MSRNNKSSFLRQNAQEHYKTYKRGKNWVYAGIFTFAISLGVGLSTQNAEASDTTPVSTDTSVVTSAANSNTASVALNSHSTNNLSEVNNAASNVSVDNASRTVAATSTSTSQTGSSVASEAIVSEPANQTDTSSASKSDRAVSAQRTSVDANQASSSADIQTLNNPTSDQIQEAKSAAEEQYQQTGQPQQINAVAADTATSGTVSTSGQWQISDGTLQIVGDISCLTTPAPWSGNTDITSIDFMSGVILPADSSNLFANLTNLTTVSDINSIDFTNITSMKNMFANDTSLTSITVDMSNSTVNNLTDVSGMFENDTSLQTADVSEMNIETVTTAADMFRNDTSLANVNAQWGIGNSIQDISGMFENTPQLTTLNISGWQMPNLTTAANFLNNLTADNQAGNSQLATIDTSQWVSDVLTDLSGAFAGNSGLTDLNLGQIGTSHVTTMANMFYQDRSLSEVDNYPKWDVSNVTDFDNLFNGTAFTTLNFEAWTPNASATMNQMLDNNSHLINITFGAGMPAMNLANINVNNPTWAAVGFGTGDANGGGTGETTTNPSGSIVTSYDGVTPDTYVLANTATITYLDADNGDQPIEAAKGTQVIIGAVSPDASYDASYLMQLPDGYQMADSTQPRLGTDVIKLGDDDSDDFTVELTHIIDTTTDDWTLQIGYINDTTGKGSTTSMGVTTVYSPDVTWTGEYDEVTKITTWTPSINSATLVASGVPVGYSPDIAAYPNGGFADSLTDPLGATYDASTQTVDFTPILQSQSGADGADPLEIGRGAYTVLIHVIADPQQAQVIFEDEDNNNAQVGAGIPINGVTNESTTYNVSQQIPTGYELADAFQPVSGNYSFTIPTSATEVPTWAPKIVLLKHVHDSGTTTTTNTVTYTGLPSNLTPADNVTSVNWNVDLDQANNDETFTPTSTGNTVTSPVIPGYTASQTTVTFTNDLLGPSDGAVNKADVPQNQKITVTYTADQQNATVTYIDDDENSTIQTDKLTGGSNTTSDYDYTGTLKGFTDEVSRAV